MDKKYKAVAITVTHKPVDEFDLVNHEIRYVIKDTENGSIVDDAQGYGYKTAQKHMPVGLTKIEINRRIEKGQRKNSSLKSG